MFNASQESAPHRQVLPHYLGSLDHECPYCHALHWVAEAVRPDEYGQCCLHGKVYVPFLPRPPNDLYMLYCSNDRRGRSFRTHIRQYNKAFAFTSTGGPGHIDGSMFDGRGPPSYKIQGELYHQLGPLQPEEGRRPLYSQLYIYDPTEALAYREGNNPATCPEIMSLLQRVLLQNNPFVPVYEQAKALTENVVLPEYRLRLDFLRAMDRRRYNLPRGQNELAAIIPGDVETCINTRDVIIRPKGGPLLRITECHPSYIALHFPLLAPTAQRGWSPDMRRYLSGTDHALSDNRLTLCDFLQFRLHPRPSHIESDHYFRSALLLQEYIVEMWLAAEHSKLRWIREHQADLRTELYTGILDALNEGLDPAAVGRKIVLPSSFVSSPRFMHHNLQNALTLLRAHGGSDLFITFTANPAWREISEALLPGQVASDRPDIVARVFHLKAKSLVDDIMKKNIFGKAVSYVYTIEYQKRGLPHMHLLLILDRSSHLSTAERVDAHVCSEFPDPSTDPDLYELVKAFMVHGPCHRDYCLDEKNHCTKSFPKPFQAETEFTSESYVKMRRRDTGRVHNIGSCAFDNRYVVSYSPYLLRRYRAHINVECTAGFQAVKYIYKVHQFLSSHCSLTHLNGNSIFTKAQIE